MPRLAGVPLRAPWPPCPRLLGYTACHDGMVPHSRHPNRALPCSHSVHDMRVPCTTACATACYPLPSPSLPCVLQVQFERSGGLFHLQWKNSPLNEDSDGQRILYVPHPAFEAVWQQPGSVPIPTHRAPHRTIMLGRVASNRSCACLVGCVLQPRACLRVHACVYRYTFSKDGKAWAPARELFPSLAAALYNASLGKVRLAPSRHT